MDEFATCASFLSTLALNKFLNSLTVSRVENFALVTQGWEIFASDAVSIFRSYERGNSSGYLCFLLLIFDDFRSKSDTFFVFDDDYSLN